MTEEEKFNELMSKITATINEQLKEYIDTHKDTDNDGAQTPSQN